MQPNELFNVCQFFASGDYEYVVRDTTAEDAMSRFCSITSSPAAELGTTVRVIITDQSDATNAEWIFGKGLVFPSPEDIRKFRENVQHQRTGG